MRSKRGIPVNKKAISHSRDIRRSKRRSWFPLIIAILSMLLSPCIAAGVIIYVLLGA